MRQNPIRASPVWGIRLRWRHPQLGVLESSCVSHISYSHILIFWFYISYRLGRVRGSDVVPTTSKPRSDATYYTYLFTHSLTYLLTYLQRELYENLTLTFKGLLFSQRVSITISCYFWNRSQISLLFVLILCWSSFFKTHLETPSRSCPPQNDPQNRPNHQRPNVNSQNDVSRT